MGLNCRLHRSNSTLSAYPGLVVHHLIINCVDVSGETTREEHAESSGREVSIIYGSDATQVKLLWRWLLSTEDSPSNKFDSFYSFTITVKTHLSKDMPKAADLTTSPAVVRPADTVRPLKPLTLLNFLIYIYIYEMEVSVHCGRHLSLKLFPLSWLDLCVRSELE